MPLTLGTRLGPYEITGPLGKGGMGEVYRAKDTKLDREVAIKVLPSSVARDPERLARFEREAKVLASLNHPNIATIYSLEESPEGKAIAMELVDGTTLKAPLPLDTALNYARQIAEALEAAHDKGVTHRDLKPANIMVTPAGLVKILDFGLAAIARPDAGRGEDSPTLTMGMTDAGVIMGTAAYMAPEQAVGSAVDRRADIWSFGVVLWQMLTGKQLFSGDTTAHILASVIKDPIDFANFPETTPASIRELLKRCLDRDVKTRLQVISEARIAVQWAIANPTTTPDLTSVPSRERSPYIPWAIVAVFAIIAAAALWGWLKPKPAETKSLIRFSVPRTDQGNAPGLSRDGSRIAYTSGPTRQINILSWDQAEPRAIPGTQGAFPPEFSPDGESLAFVAADEANRAFLKKVTLAGQVQMLADVSGGAYRHPFWGADGNIWMATAQGIARIPATGGKFEVILPPTLGAGTPALPQLLPGGKGVLFSLQSRNGIRVLALDLDSHKQTVLLEDAGIGRFLPVAPDSERGYILYNRGGSLWAVPFDSAKLQTIGAAVPVQEGLAGGAAGLGVSAAGAIAYTPGAGDDGLQEPVLVSRDGKAQSLGAPPRIYGLPKLSPSADRVALEVRTSIFAAASKADAWIFDITRRTLNKATFGGDSKSNGWPVWTPDGKIVFAGYVLVGDTKRPDKVLLTSADGGGTPVTLAETADDISRFTTSVASDGKTVFGYANSQPAQLFALELPRSGAKPNELRTIFPSPSGRRYPYISPDGRWLAYESNESGIREIFVEAFPGSATRTQVSSGGATEPRWGRNGRELFFRQGAKMMAVEMQTSPTLRAGTPKMLFEDFPTAAYDVAPDGRFLMLRDVSTSQGDPPIHVVLNFIEELKRKVPLGGK
ncbi:MAG: protein kinase [Acidobacteriota bacterium]